MNRLGLEYIRLGIAMSETDQATKEFAATVKAIRDRYSWFTKLLYKLGVI